MRLTAGLLVLLCIITSSWADDGLREAERALDRGRYDAAITAAAALFESPRDFERRAARLIAAEALMGLGRYGEVITTLSPLLVDHPPERVDAPWVTLLARALQSQGLLMESADWWLTYVSFGRDERREGERHLSRILEVGLAPGELAYLFWKYPQQALLADAARAYSRAEARQGHPEEAYRAWVLANETRGERTPAPDWLTPPTQRLPGSDYFTVGLLAPINGPHARYGISLANGADAARRMHNARARFPIRLEIADTGGTPQGCLEAVQGLYERGVRVFLGEIFSVHTLVAAAYLKDRGALLFSPAATDSAISLLGPGTYFCVVEPEDQLAEMTRYAGDSLYVRNLALLWPSSPSGAQWARCFGELARGAGMRILHEQSFPPGTMDFVALLERTDGVVPDSIDALFCSGEMRELVALLSQIAHDGYLGPFLGTPAMGDPVVRRVVEEFGLRTLYPGDTYVAAAPDPGSAGFEETYRHLYGEEPDDFAYRGWTGFALAGAAIERGGYCPEALREIMEADAFPSVRAGRGRHIAIPEDLGVPAIYYREGSFLKLARRDPPPIAPPDSTELFN